MISVKELFQGIRDRLLIREFYRARGENIPFAMVTKKMSVRQDSLIHAELGEIYEFTVDQNNLLMW